MKSFLMIGIMLVILASLFAGMGTATSRSNMQWGFKEDINLHDEFASYLGFGYDAVIYEINQEFANMGGGYKIADHGSNLIGEALTAGDISENGNNVDFKIGNYIGSKLELSASGTFPYASTIENMINDTYTPRQMDISLTLYYNHKMIVSGTAVTDGNGNVTSMSSSINYNMYLHVKGNNLPLSFLLYSLLKSKATHWVDMDVYFYFLNSTNNSICFEASISSWSGYNLGKGLKISGFSINYPNATVRVEDENGNGYLDDGETLCIIGNVTKIKNALNNGTAIYITYTDPVNNVSDSAYLSYYGYDFFDLGSLYIEYQYIDPEISTILNQTKNLPPYDDFDFIITVNYTEHTSTAYSPYLPLLPRRDTLVNITETGTYSGIINIQGLQSKYAMIAEKILNLTFPVNIQDINTHSDEFNHGKINVHTSIYIPASAVVGTRSYGGEKVYVVSFPNNISFVGPFARAMSPGMYYYYSPTKKFIVGFDTIIGFNDYSTEATTYQDASNEINNIKNKDVTQEINENNNCNIFTCAFFSIGPIPFNLITLSIIAAIIAIVFVVVHYKKSKSVS